MKLHLDLTSWVETPSRSLGLCARRLDESLRRVLSLDSGVQMQAVSRASKSSFPASNTSIDDLEVLKRIEELSWIQKWRGMNGIYHSLDSVLPPLKKSFRISTIHDCWDLQDNPYSDMQVQRKLKKSLLKTIERSDHIVLPTEHVREKLCEHDASLRSRTSVIPWAGFLNRELRGTSLHKAQAGTQPDRPYNSLVEAYLAKGRPFFLCVANFEVRKNHRLLFEAMRGLHHADLVLVGNKGFGWQDIEKQRQDLCSDNPCFWFQNLGAHDLVRLYEKSLALVLPSFDEGFGLPACEGIQFQKPLLLSQINAFYEIAGNAAIYFDPHNGLNDLKRALVGIAEDANLRNSWASKTLARQHLFSWELTAREHLKLYRKLSAGI